MTLIINVKNDLLLPSPQLAVHSDPRVPSPGLESPLTHCQNLNTAFPHGPCRQHPTIHSAPVPGLAVIAASDLGYCCCPVELGVCDWDCCWCRSRSEPSGCRWQTPNPTLQRYDVSALRVFVLVCSVLESQMLKNSNHWLPVPDWKGKSAPDCESLCPCCLHWSYSAGSGQNCPLIYQDCCWSSHWSALQWDWSHCQHAEVPRAACVWKQHPDQWHCSAGLTHHRWAVRKNQMFWSTHQVNHFLNQTTIQNLKKKIHCISTRLVKVSLLQLAQM